MKNILFTLTMLFSIISYSQETIEITSIVPTGITVCDTSENFQVSITNNSTNTITTPNIVVKLPTGIEYISSSIQEESNFSVQESNITDNTNLVFTCNNIPADAVVNFTIQTKAIVNAIAYQQQGNIFRNQISLNYNQTESIKKTSNAYNVYYGALNIIKVSPTAKTVTTGDSFSREITIVNAGNGRLNSFQLATTQNKAGLILSETNLGTLNTTKDTLTLSTSDFETIGNNDGYFDTNEKIIVTQTFNAEGCTAYTVTSTMNTAWGCNNNIRSATNSYANTTIQLTKPNLNISAKSSLSSLFAQEASPQEITLANTGKGYANNVTVDIFKSTGGAYNQNIFSRIDPSSFTYQIGMDGIPTSLSPSQVFETKKDGSFSRLGNNPIGRVIITLPEPIAPNQTIIIKWNNYHATISACDNDKLMGWKYTVNYQDTCNTSNYTKTLTGEGKTNLNMSVFTETPTDIQDQQTLPFVYTISSHDNNLPIGENAQYKVIITLPKGLDWAGGENDFTWTSSPNNWVPNSVNFDATTRQLTGTFLVPEPFNIQKSEILVNLTGNCNESETTGTKEIKLDIKYTTNTNCNDCLIDMVCDQTTTTKLHCPDNNCEGFNFKSFTAKRINYGQPDNDTNGLADANGNIDLTKIKTNRVMVGDTLQTTYNVLVKTGAKNDKFNNFYVEADIDFGKNLTFLNGTITIFDTATNTNYTCTSFDTKIVEGANSSRKFRYSFDPNNACTELPNTPGYGDNFFFTDGDTIEFNVNYKVTGNIQGNVKEVTINNDLFTSSLNNPWDQDAAALSTDKWACDDYDGRFTLIGYFFNSGTPKDYSVTSCSRVVSQNYYFSVGDCCDNYGGGNLFPYEYRNWAHIKEASVQIPNNYAVLNMYLKQYRTKNTNTTVTQTIKNITPYHNSGGFMKFNLEQYHKNAEGTLEYSDDGFSGTIFIELAPNCEVPTKTKEDINWEFKFAKTANIGNGETEWLTDTPDTIEFNPAVLEVTSDTPIVDGLGKTVSWNVNVKNNATNADAYNSWIHFKTPSETIEFVSITDDATGEVLEMTSDYFELGTIAKNSQKSYTVVGKYAACTPDYMIAYSGYECSGYPESFTNFKCNYSTLGLRVEPKNAEPQVTITGTTIGNECSSVVEITVEVASVRFAHLDEIEIDIKANDNSITFLENSGELKYPLTGEFTSVSNPENNNGINTYKINNISTELKGYGLPGVLELEKNRFQLKFKMNLENNFTSGDFATISIKSKEVCGTELPTINLAYDPSVQFNQNKLAGLSDDISNSWGISWGDYDNDGFDDLYVAEYDKNKGSYLYHNNRDGSFTKVTNSPITNGKGSSIAGTWGDYNNDGLLDLFVANNVGAVNALYKNNGGGNFTKVTTGAIANYGGYCHGASWVDYNNDGYLDLFVTDYMPTKFNVLYKNNGDETFTEVKNTSLVQEAKNSIGATWADYDGDGDMDVFIPATNGQSNSLFRNNGGDVFEKMTNIGITADNANSVGCSWGDFDNDLDLDLFVTNTSGQDNFLYQNNGDGTFTQITNTLVTSDGGHSSSSNFIDFDNDGDLDLYVCNDQDDENTLYINDGTGVYTKPENPLSSNLGNSYSQAWSDFDNDGDLDLFVGNHSNEKNVFFENSRANCNSWLCINLKGNNSNKSAIGTRIKVLANIYGQDVWQLTEVSAQTGGGAGSQNSLKKIIGLGDATVIKKIVVEWSSGYVQEILNYGTNTCLDVEEEEGILVCGTSYNDENLNCIQDEGEKGIPGVVITAMPGNRKVTTDEYGNYQLFLNPGSYTITQQTPENWNSTCGFDDENGYEVTISQGKSYCGNNFGNTTQCVDPNLFLTLGTTALRKGFTNDYTVVYGNTGAFDGENVSLSMEFPEDIIPVSASIPWDEIVETAEGYEYIWKLGNVKSMTNHNITIVDSISVASNVSTELTVRANIYNEQKSDCDTEDNTVIDVNPIVGAIDPNDILVFPSGDGPQGYINPDQVLKYKIRFENVGTWYAQNIYVDNKVPLNLDISTIHDIVCSHPYELVREQNILYFKFKNIYLPESSKDEINSHGFIEYKIYPKEEITPGEMIENSANIVFDYEEPLATNVVLNTIKHNANSSHNSVSIYPNPVSTTTTINLIVKDYKYLGNSKAEKVILFDVNGKAIQNLNYRLENNSIILDLSGFASGIYIVKVFDNLHNQYVGKVMKK
ncbi:FG-GAP-like repeat-containing protein [Wenyingzhuangia aestuarii]|uniref:FG-GAP-like repeat-containing protein n=1 Tax=Wenyingzhuangia aestuarii TaxID=1647582 RepID=UPI00143C6FE7|nr:FG-GAP-like repeat-containing protein [Wenyingzhuangia aestuarii]NJB82469.1 hypothetical protein [Wenyingzhuangia aestuarii]